MDDFSDGKELVASYNNLSRQYAKAHDNEAALNILMKAYAVADQAQDFVYTATVCVNIAKLLCAKTEHERALRYAQKALALLSKVEKPGSLLVTAYQTVAQELSCLAMPNEAKEALTTALFLSKRYFGQTHETTDRLKGQLASLKSRPIRKAVRIQILPNRHRHAHSPASCKASRGGFARLGSADLGRHSGRAAVRRKLAQAQELLASAKKEVKYYKRLQRHWVNEPMY